MAAHPGPNFAKDHFFPPSLLQQQRTLTLTLNSLFELEFGLGRSLTTPASVPLSSIQPRPFPVPDLPRTSSGSHSADQACSVGTVMVVMGREGDSMRVDQVPLMCCVRYGLM